METKPTPNPASPTAGKNESKTGAGGIKKGSDTGYTSPVESVPTEKRENKTPADKES